MKTQTPTPKKSRTFLRRASVAGLFAALTICPTGSVPEAHAQFSEKDWESTSKFISFVSTGYDVISKVLKFLRGPNDPVEAAATRIVNALNQVERNIMGQLEAQMFFIQASGQVSLFGKMQTVIDRYEVISAMRTDNTRLEPMRALNQAQAEELLTTFGETVTSGHDIEAVYDLAPAYNTLLIQYFSMVKMAGEIQPSGALPVQAYSIQARRGMETNYRLIGTQKQACGGETYPPTRDRYFIGGNGVLHAPQSLVAYTTSELFVKKLGNRWTTYHSPTSGADMDCNLATRQCFAPSFVVGGGSFQSCDNPNHSSLRASFQACLGKAVGTTVRNAFNADPVVQGIRASMAGLMKLGLVAIATPGGGFPGTDIARAAYFDPWVVNTPCGTDLLGRAAGRTYPITP